MSAHAAGSRGDLLLDQIAERLALVLVALRQTTIELHRAAHDRRVHWTGCAEPDCRRARELTTLPRD